MVKCGPKIKWFPWKPLFYTKVSMATITAPLSAILKHAKEQLNFNSVAVSRFGGVYLVWNPY